MFVQIRKTIVIKGNSEAVVNRFSKEGLIEKQPGFIDLSVMVKRGRRGDTEEEVVILIRWESEARWKEWEQNEDHLAGHRAARGKPKPEYVVHAETAFYHVKGMKKPV